jgi:adenylyltransferase/sulfurtransferase
MALEEFSREQIERYSRHIRLAGFGPGGQRKLLESSVLMVGAGGLGSAALPYLAAAGVGKIGIADDDWVELPNLHRQVIYFSADIGRRKTASAAETLRALNPDCRVTTHPVRLSASNIQEIVRGYDLVLDGSDNFPTRFLVADCCWFEKIPLVSAAAVGFEGQLFTVLPGPRAPCHRCLMPEPPEADRAASCRLNGILGPVAGVMGTLQAVEALKVLLGIGSDMAERFLQYNALEGSFRTLKRTQDPDCPLCGEQPSITSLSAHSIRRCADGQSESCHHGDLRTG